MISDQEIAVFAELENPQVQSVYVDQLRSGLEATVQNSFLLFSPDDIKTAAMHAATGDSFYGARMGVVKRILTTAMYAPEGFTQYLLQTSNELGGQYEVAVHTPQKDSRIADYFRTSRLAPAGIKARLERNREHKEQENRRVHEFKVLSDVYREMAEVVAEIGKEYRDASVADIFRLAEVNHFFSGKWNGTGRNLTFSNERIKGYGARLQQLVQRVWDTTARIYHPETASRPTDTPTPLSPRELFPPKYMSKDF